MRRILSVSVLLIMTLGLLPTQSAGAASKTTALPFSSFSSMVVDSVRQRVFVSSRANTEVIQLDFNGNIVASLAGIPNPSGMVLSGSTLYVAAYGGSRIEAWDAAAVPPTRISTYSTAPLTSPNDLVLAGGKLWFTSKCGQWDGKLASMELDGTNVTQHPPDTFAYWTYCPALMSSPQAPDRIFMMASGISPNTLYEYDVATGAPVEVHSDDFGWGNFGWSEIGVMPGGDTFVMGSTAGGGIGEYQMDNMFGPIDTYQPLSGLYVDSGSVIVTPAAGGRIASSSWDYFNNVVQTWDIGTLTPKQSWVLPEELFARGLAFSPDGLSLFAVSGDYYYDTVNFNVLSGTGFGPQPPDTTIDSGPTGNVASPEATFTFSADEPATFKCKIDSGSYSTCTSPVDYQWLTSGAHTFSVKAVNGAAGADLTPATRTWTVIPPNTTIDTGPIGTTASSSATFTFSADAPASFECKIDTGSYSACTSPKSYLYLAGGTHVFSVRAFDAVGNTDASPATRVWTADYSTGKSFTTLSIDAPVSVPKNTNAHITGSLSSADSECTYGQPLKLKKGTRVLQTQLTAADGSYDFDQLITGSSTVKVVYSGTVSCRSAASVRKTIAVT